MELKKSAHAVYKTQYHIVWVTRYRRKILVKVVDEYLRVKLKEVEKYYPDWEQKEVGIAVDHVHVHMVIPPKYAVSRAIDVMKANTSCSLKEKFSFLKKVYWDGGGIWSKGFFVSTVGVNEEVIRKYVEMQGKEDSGQAELEF